jgi:hypothetical protein
MWPTELFVLEYGYPFKAVARPKGMRKGRAKKCFVNADRLASRDASYEFAEGYAWNSKIGSPFHHAWCVSDGVAIDPTLNESEMYEYLGIVIPRGMRSAEISRRRLYAILEGDTGPNLEFFEAWKSEHPKQFVADLPPYALKWGRQG